MRICLLLTILITRLTVFGQPVFEDEITGDEHLITDTTSDKIIERFLVSSNYRNIEFNPNKQSLFSCRIQLENGDWRLFSDDYGGVIAEQTKSLKGYSYTFPSPIMEYYEFTWLHSDKGYQPVSFFNSIKSYKYSWDTLLIENHAELDNLILKYIQPFSDGIDPDSEEFFELENEKEQIRYKLPDEIYGFNVLAKKDGKYTRLTLNRDTEMQLLNVKAQQVYENYFSFKDLPPPLYYDHFGMEKLIKARKKYKIKAFYPMSALYEIEATEGDLIADNELLVQSVKDNKWGIYHQNNIDYGPQLTIPMIYDSIQIVRYGDFEYVYQVWQDGKLGCLDYNHRLIIPIGFDAMELMHLDYTYGAALKKDNGWLLYDLYDGSFLVDEPQQTQKKLLNYWLNNPK